MNIFERNIKGQDLDLKDEFFDIVDIDGSHYYLDIYHDIVNSERILMPGRLICGDDLEIQFHEAHIDESHRSRFIDYVEDNDVGFYHPGVTLAVYDVFGEVSSFGGFWVMRKIANGKHKLVQWENHMEAVYPCYLSADQIKEFSVGFNQHGSYWM